MRIAFGQKDGAKAARIECRLAIGDAQGVPEAAREGNQQHSEHDIDRGVDGQNEWREN